MAKILAPNKQYTGTSASVSFCNGIGETDNPDLIAWFKEHNYQVIEKDISEVDEKGKEKYEEMSVEELVAFAQEKGIDIGKASSQSGIIEKIKAAIGSSEETKE